MDDADRASELQAADLTRSLAKRKTENEKLGKLHTRLAGTCLNCETKISPDKIFCDSDCRDDYERISRAHQQRPRGS